MSLHDEAAPPWSPKVLGTLGDDRQCCWGDRWQQALDRWHRPQTGSRRAQGPSDPRRAELVPGDLLCWPQAGGGGPTGTGTTGQGQAPRGGGVTWAGEVTPAWGEMTPAGGGG